MMHQFFMLSKMNMMMSFNNSNYIMSLSSLWMMSLILFFLKDKNFNNVKFIFLFKLFIKILSSLNSSNNLMKKMFYSNYAFMMMLVFLMNLYSLTMWSFSLTSQLSINLIFIFNQWLAIFMMDLKNFKLTLCSFSPKSAPIFMLNFLILIEFVSYTIRPLILMLRLTINMFSGHVMMSMISMSMMHLKSLMISSIIMMSFLILKIIMSLIQSMILSMLMCIYLKQSSNLFI